MKRTIAVLSIAILLISFAFFALNAIAAKSTNGSSSAVLSKLSKVIANQEDILSRLEEMKKELYIIKIRASQR